MFDTSIFMWMALNKNEKLLFSWSLLTAKQSKQLHVGY